MEKAVRYSAQRERILSYITHSKNHPSAEMIHCDLRAESPELSLGTVYRNLTFLEKQGKIRRLTTLNGHDRYDAVRGEHVHFICQACNAIIDLPQVDVEKIRQAVFSENSYEIDRVDTIISGKCPQCLNQIPMETK